MPATIALQDLEALGACPEQVAIFAATFPDGITITPDNAATVAKAAAEAGLDAGWYANHALLDDELAAYAAAVAPARTAYAAAVAPVLAAYRAAVSEARATYRVATEAKAWAAYEAVEAPAQTARDAAEAEALCAILARRGV